MDKPIFALPVRELVETVLSQGDLMLSPGSARRMQEGTKLHQRYQTSVEVPGYQAEVPLCYTFESPRLSLEISGRIDGMIEDNGHVILEELKTTAMELSELTPYPPAHGAGNVLWRHVVFTPRNLSHYIKTHLYSSRQRRNEDHHHRIFRPATSLANSLASAEHS